MRLHGSFLIALLAAAPPSAAQMPAPRGWHLGVGADALRFGHTSLVADGSGLEAEVRPSGRVALHLAVGRSAGPWDFSLEAGWAQGHLEAGNDDFSIRDLTSDVSRYRLALAIGRRLAALGGGALFAELAPTLDVWSVVEDGRARGGAEGRLVLRVPLGGVELEHRIGVGLSGSPIEAADLGPVAEERGLRTLVVGVGVRGGL